MTSTPPINPDHEPTTAADRLLADLQTAALTRAHALLDVEAGLCEITTARHHSTIRAAARPRLDIEAGLQAITGARSQPATRHAGPEPLDPVAASRYGDDLPQTRGLIGEDTGVSVSGGRSRRPSAVTMVVLPVALALAGNLATNTVTVPWRWWPPLAWVILVALLVAMVLVEQARTANPSRPRARVDVEAETAGVTPRPTYDAQSVSGSVVTGTINQYKIDGGMSVHVSGARNWPAPLAAIAVIGIALLGLIFPMNDPSKQPPPPMSGPTVYGPASTGGSDPSSFTGVTARIVNTWDAAAGTTIGLYEYPRPDNNQGRINGPGEGQTVHIVCQVRNGRLATDTPYRDRQTSSTVWDRLSDGYYISDIYTDLPKTSGAATPPGVSTC